jgi:hypothetical protein
MFEGVIRAQVNNDGVITKLKLLNGERRMASAIDAGIATIMIIVLFERGARARVRCGNFRRGYLTACRCHVTLHGMSTFVRDIDCCGQHDHEENQRKEFQMDYFSHKYFLDYVRPFQKCQELNCSRAMYGCHMTIAEHGRLLSPVQGTIPIKWEQINFKKIQESTK